MRSNELLSFVNETFDAEALPALTEYIRIPNKSPIFDARWAESGHMGRAAKLIGDWCRRRRIEGMTVDLVQDPGRTPLLLIDVPARGGGTPEDVLIYGHLDKQPEMVGWSEGLAPFEPVLRGDRLYGRGGADDGYAAFSALIALEALERSRTPRPRVVVLIEGSEESGSPDLPHYVEAYAARIGRPGLVICLDSGCGDYDRLWCTTSLRGLVAGDLVVRNLSEGVHSGDAGGIVPSTFRIARQLLTRIEDEATGAVRLDAANVEIPAVRRTEAQIVAEVLGEALYRRFPFVPGAQPTETSLAELVLDRTWRPALEVTGAAGLPSLEQAGNVARPFTSLRLSLRIPPTADPDAVLAALSARLAADPPCGASVEFTGECAGGWHAPPCEPWLLSALDRSSNEHFGRGVAFNGEGGSIPFMGMLGQRFPEAQFVITGVLGPQSNAHGPNEFLHLPTAKRVTACVASLLTAVAAREGTV